MSKPSAVASMNIVLNGEAESVPSDLTAASLIELLELGGKRLALEVNGEIVPRSRYGIYRLQADDRVEIVHAIGGG